MLRVDPVVVLGPLVSRAAPMKQKARDSGISKGYLSTDPSPRGMRRAYSLLRIYSV